MFQTQTVSPTCVGKPAVPAQTPAPVPKFSAELMRMLAQLAMLR